jgi:hypothetical protein
MFGEKKLGIGKTTKEYHACRTNARTELAAV